MRLVLTWNLSSIARLGIEIQISSVVSPANDPWFQLETWCAEFSMCSVVKLLAPHCRKCHLKPDKWEHKKMYSCVKYTEAPWATTWKVWKQHYSCVGWGSFPVVPGSQADLNSEDCGIAAVDGQPQMDLPSWCACQLTWLPNTSSLNMLGHTKTLAMAGLGVGAK